jgi:DinB family protein
VKSTRKVLLLSRVWSPFQFGRAAGQSFPRAKGWRDVIISLFKEELYMKRPEATEFAEYYTGYIAKVPGTDLLRVLESERLQMQQLFAGRTERDGNFRYAPGKWTVKEILGHITDAERIFTYRALRIARGDQTPLPGFEQDDFVKNGGFAGRTLGDLVEDFGAVRSSSIALFRSFGEEAWSRRGVASQKEVTVRALGFMTAGHQIHHRAILEERYFPAIPRA